jgi:hypothetical protein
MEILIPGLVLVGLMVWASTRIKRNAARAYEREEIDTTEFTLVKPEGFLAPVDPAEGTVFSAYSKEYGRDDSERVRRAAIEVRRFADVSFDDVRRRTGDSAAGVIEEQIGVIDQAKCANMVIAGFSDGVPVETHLKIVAARDAVYQVSIAVLPEHKDEFLIKIDETLGSFSLK